MCFLYCVVCRGGGWRTRNACVAKFGDDKVALQSELDRMTKMAAKPMSESANRWLVNRMNLIGKLVEASNGKHEL